MCIGLVRNGRVTVRAGCTAGGRAGLALVVSVGSDVRSQARAWASRRPWAETFNKQCARDKQTKCAEGLGSVRTLSVATKACWLAVWAKAWSMCGTCDEAVKDDNRPSIWQLRDDAGKAVMDGFHCGWKQFWAVFPSSWRCQLYCYAFICFSWFVHEGLSFERVSLEIENQSGISNRLDVMEARLRRVEELTGKPKQPPTMGLIQQVSVVQEAVENLKRKVKEELPQFVEKGLVSVPEEIGCLFEVVDIKLEALKTDIRLVKKTVASSGTKGSAVALKAAKVLDAEKVSITSMYLTEDAKLWWRYCLSDDASANRECIETWKVLKKELNDQLLPCNTSWVARESLRNLRHTRMVSEFVKEFISLMLNARDMLKEDKLFTLWQRNDNSGEGKTKFGKKFKKKEKAKEVVIETSHPRAVEKPKVGYFICGNIEHRARDCLKRGRLNTIVAEQIDDERGTELAQMVAMQLGTLQVQSCGCGETHKKGLMMVEDRINGKEMKALVDMGATNNFIFD
ncbi:UNVERIFIED_CONTAM: hypothetical protein Scaly_1920700 [Sesamum calycinum]|uniref:Retrotransposon gag domain-containing protein n=1 Tax=Sesamum calycinum TaxID=2727403 RepID=A0AAW2NJ73_9LAMI